MPFYDLVCAEGHEQIDVLLKLGERPPCPTCQGSTETLWRGTGRGVIADDIPGGVLIYHGLCNEDSTPRRYYTKSEMRAEAKRRGLHNHVEHVSEPGTDKAKYTSRWI